MMSKLILRLIAAFTLIICQPAQATDRVALVIGNKDYPKAPLDNPVNDAQDMKTALERVGFKVIYRENANKTSMDDAVREFASSLGKNSIGVVYYSGHGVQADGVNYLIPVDGDITSKAELKSRGYDAGIILDEMKAVDNPVNVVILDACRNNPFKGFSRGGQERGLATMNGSKGMLIAYATAPGSVAGDSDGSSGQNGLYTGYLKQYLVQPGLTIEEMFKKVRESVIKKSPDQVPWKNSSITGNFCFAGCTPQPIPAADKPQIENAQIKILQERLQQAERDKAAQQQEITQAQKKAQQAERDKLAQQREAEKAQKKLQLREKALATKPQAVAPANPQPSQTPQPDSDDVMNRLKKSWLNQ